MSFDYLIGRGRRATGDRNTVGGGGRGLIGTRYTSARPAITIT